MTLPESAIAVPPAPETITWIAKPEELNEWLDSAPGLPLVLDTEFERVSTFYPIPGLVQLGLGDSFCLVDPDVAERSTRFREILAEPSVTKLLYAMSEDLELFRDWLGINPKGVVDLQIGAAMAGAGFSLGYARLVETLFGEALDKSVTRSDWVSRPLSEAQQRYAIEDIRFLAPMYEWVSAHLRERGLEAALVEESARFAEELAGQDDPHHHYLRLRGGWALTAEQQFVLKELVIWRELESRERNRPRGRVLADPLLIAIAERMPGSLNELSDIQGVPGGVVRRYGEALLKLVDEGRGADTTGLDRIAPPLTREQQDYFKGLKRFFRKAAEAADIPIELLAPRKRLEKVVQESSLAGSPFFHGWRTRILAPVMNDIEDYLQS
ncbi:MULTISPECIES: ribonuclease D [Marinobacter]|uniref:HRDC domain-containing protein n=1 Tax=Marinobacter xiaoshiensis TaxID=3073652 RepID=A0ABU2HJA6_9GAMM|nr:MULTISPECIES: HRDC domain-containing protein [unclassified Marinobacter]MBK1885962.1 HRDC domain-containing protein [Marinobacter sp. DY40_1A1]MDS1310410.1 HRDC domain-containing protein [Marinobacter sp. F60267]